MENRGSKSLALAALVVGVVGLTIGFAAFATTLTINPTATVNPDTTSGAWDIKGTTFTCEGTAGNTAEGAVKPTGTASWSNTSNQEVEGTISATLSYPGDSVTCTGTVQNAGEYVAYLNSVSHNGLDADCTDSINGITNETSKTLATQACEGVKITALTVGGDDYKIANTSISNHTVANNTTEDVVITITYDENATRADEPFTAKFTGIELNYSSAD